MKRKRDSLMVSIVRHHLRPVNLAHSPAQMLSAISSAMMPPMEILACSFFDHGSNKQERLRLLHQAALGLNYIHKKGIVRGDLKLREQHYRRCGRTCQTDRLRIEHHPILFDSKGAGMPVHPRADVLLPLLRLVGHHDRGGGAHLAVFQAQKVAVKGCGAE
jgi:serine/threonine protein kinase